MKDLEILFKIFEAVEPTVKELTLFKNQNLYQRIQLPPAPGKEVSSLKFWRGSDGRHNKMFTGCTSLRSLRWGTWKYGK